MQEPTPENNGDAAGDENVNIAILSGKGGTGKTTIAVNLSVVAGANYIDSDVEEPNGFIFLNPSQITSQEVTVDYPIIDSSKCALCGKCVKACQFNALVNTKREIILFEKLCHSCRACAIVCKHDAITFGKRTIGMLQEGTYKINEPKENLYNTKLPEKGPHNIKIPEKSRHKIDMPDECRHKNIICKRGILNVGEPVAVPVIKDLLKNLPESINLIDCAPGTSCNVVTALQYADGAILVTEPSSFGLHDLKMAVQLARNFNLPFGVVINKFNADDNRIQMYCEEENIEILGVIPYSREAAEIYSSGKIMANLPEYREAFRKIADRLREVLPWN